MGTLITVAINVFEVSFWFLVLTIVRHYGGFEMAVILGLAMLIFKASQQANQGTKERVLNRDELQQVIEEHLKNS